MYYLLISEILFEGQSSMGRQRDLLSTVAGSEPRFPSGAPTWVTGVLALEFCLRSPRAPSVGSWITSRGRSLLAFQSGMWGCHKRWPKLYPTMPVPAKSECSLFLSFILDCLFILTFSNKTLTFHFYFSLLQCIYFLEYIFLAYCFKNLLQSFNSQILIK